MKRDLGMSRTCMAAICCFAILCPSALCADSVQGIQILKISSQDQRAVIQQADGAMRIVKVGDVVGDSGTITEIAPGRVVLDKVSDRETERIIIHLEKGEQRVERLKRSAAKQPMLFTPNAAKIR